MSNLVKHINDADFEAEVIKCDTPVLVDFWAEWCGPCKMIGPLLDQLAGNYEGKLKIVKVNVDENQKYAAEYNVRGIPTLLIFKAGQLIKTQVGAINKAQLEQIIDASIA